MYEGNHKFIIIMLMTAVIFCGIVGVVSGAYEAKPTFNVSFGIPVNVIDTNENGSLILAGLSNGSIFAYNQTGYKQWMFKTNDSVQKLLVDNNGNSIYINNANETGYITAAGSRTLYNKSSVPFKDISWTGDHNTFSTTTYNPSSIVIYNKTSVIGGILTPNYYWTGMVYDSNNGWLVTKNWSYTGVGNATEKQTDGYLYVYNIVTSTSNTSATIIYNNRTFFSNYTTLLSIPNNGGLVTSGGFSTYLISNYVTSKNFTEYVNAIPSNINDGVAITPLTFLKVTESLTKLLEVRLSTYAIYTSDSIVRAQSSLYSNISTSDISDKDSNFVIFGEESGEIKIIAYTDDIGSYYELLTLTNGSKVISSAVSDYGDYSCFGRFDGSMNCTYNKFDLNYVPPNQAQPQPFEIVVTKSNSPYKINITVQESISYPYTWNYTIGNNNFTDDNGMVYISNASYGYYYKIIVGANEASKIITNDGNVVTINIDSIYVAPITSFVILTYKNGKPYQTNFTINESTSYPYTWSIFKNNIYSDSNGVLNVPNATYGNYYMIRVGANETMRIIQNNGNDVIIDINTLKQNLSFSMTADFNKTYPGNMTISYTDQVIPSYVKVQISEAETGKIVYTNSFTTNNNILMVYNGNPSIDYKVQWIYERNGVVGINQKVVGQNPSIVIPGDEIFKQAVFSILFLIICGLFTYQTRTIGMFICAFIYAAFVFIGFLPFTLTNIVALMAILAVAAVFGESKDRGI